MTREFLLEAIVPLYILWGSTWLIVLRYYAEAAYVSWVQGGGSWLRAPAELFRLSTCLLLGMFRDPPTSDQTYTGGHLLQLGIAMSSISSAMFGLFFWGVDRSDYSTSLLAVMILSVYVSMLGGLVHLYAPMRVSRLRLWKFFFFLCLVTPSLWALLRLSA